ncbi:MAG: GNAT family N-acetyltransferase [Negativicutes bacterium]|nr:GNAT family N-acetyltransferase [Negativicutes bacterium]
MSNNVLVRQARIADIDAMIVLLATLFSLEADFAADATRQRRGLKLLVEDGASGCLFVAECQGRVIGMCSAQLLISTAEGGRKALVEDVVVDAGHRGGGVGRKLLGAVEEWARCNEVKRLDLLADRNNQGGLAFYDAMQWNRTELIALQKKIVNQSVEI